MSNKNPLKELQAKFPDMVFIDPTNIKPIHPDFFEKTAEEKTEQNALGTNTDKIEFIFVQDEFQELFNSPCESLNADALENNLIKEIMERGSRFSQAIRPFTFYHTDNRPSGIVQHKDLGMFADHEQSMFSNEAILKFLENHEWDSSKGHWITKKHIPKIGLGKNKKKAKYKNKAYKNTAKKANPSSILLGLIKNNNK